MDSAWTVISKLSGYIVKRPPSPFWARLVMAAACVALPVLVQWRGCFCGAGGALVPHWSGIPKPRTIAAACYCVPRIIFSYSPKFSPLGFHGVSGAGLRLMWLVILRLSRNLLQAVKRFSRALMAGSWRSNF